MSSARPVAGLPTCAVPANAAASKGRSLVATTRGAIPRYARPGGAEDGTIPASWYGAASALAVIAQQPGWLETTRHVTLFRLDQPILSAPAGVGTGQDPTPTGQYFVALFEASPNPGFL